MRYQIYGITLSFFVHAAGIFLLITFCRFVPVETKTLRIDFSTFSVPRPEPVPAKAVVPVRPKSAPSLVPKKKMVKEKPPVPIARIKPAKKRDKVIQPQSEVKAVVLPPEPEPAVAAGITGPAPAPTPRRMANSTENLTAQSASETVVSQRPTGTAAGQSLMGKKEYIKAHFLYIKEDIEKKMTYPRLARKMGWEGKVVVSFVIREDGTVTNIRILKSSGFTLLDKNAVESIKKAVPFPNPPVRAELVVPISYRLS